MGKVVVAGNADFASAYKALTSTNGNTTLNKFTGVTRTGDGNGFQEGDVISLPDTLEGAIVGVAMPNSSRKAEALLCQITSKTGAIRFQPFFVNALAKRILTFEVNDEGAVVPKTDKYTKPDGTAAAWWQGRAGRDVNEVVRELIAEGKDIRIDKAEIVKTYAFGTTNVTNTVLYTYNFV